MRTAVQDQAASNWLTVSEVAADPRLRIGRRVVLQMIAAGEFDAMDVSAPGSQRKTWRINPASVDALIERRRVRRAA